VKKIPAGVPVTRSRRGVSTQGVRFPVSIRGYLENYPTNNKGGGGDERYIEKGIPIPGATSSLRDNYEDIFSHGNPREGVNDHRFAANIFHTVQDVGRGSGITITLIVVKSRTIP